MTTRSGDRTYGQYCPVAKSLDLVGDRWTLLIVRDLLRGKRRFKDLQESLVGIAPNLLSERLKRLERAGLVVRKLFKQIPPKVEYTLTGKGLQLDLVLRSLARFGMSTLMERPSDQEMLDAELIFQAMPAVFLPEQAEGVDAVFRVELKGEGGGTWRVRISPEGCEIPYAGPHEDNVVIKTAVRTWVELAAGLIEPAEAERGGLVEIEGDRELAGRFGDFFLRWRESDLGAKSA